MQLEIKDSQSPKRAIGIPNCGKREGGGMNKQNCGREACSMSASPPGEREGREEERERTELQQGSLLHVYTST